MLIAKPTTNNYRRTYTLLGNHNHNSHDHARGSCGCRLLADLKVNGKARPWRDRKAASRAIASGYQCISEETGDQSLAVLSDRVRQCGSALEFARIQGPQGTRRKVSKAQFCKARLCPVCQWRRATENAKQLEQIVEAHWFGAEAWGPDGIAARVEPSPKDRALFVTFTAKSVAGEDLPAEIDRFYTAFDRIRRTKRFKGFVTSWFRSLEVTHNPDTGLYHPHFHVLLMVKPDYFSNPSYYLDQRAGKREWSKWWGWALDVDYVPIVDVRILTGSQGGRMNEAVRKSMRELTKYCTKPEGFTVKRGDDFSVSPAVLKALHESLKGRRLFGWGGKFKEARKVLQLQDVESDDADLVGSVGLAEGETVEAIEVYGWRYVAEVKRWDYLLLYERPPEDEGGGMQGERRSDPRPKGAGEPQTPLH